MMEKKNRELTQITANGWLIIPLLISPNVSGAVFQHVIQLPLEYSVRGDSTWQSILSLGDSITVRGVSNFGVLCDLDSLTLRQCSGQLIGALFPERGESVFA